MRRLVGLLVLAAFGCLFMVYPPKAAASVNDFVVTDFSADYYLSNSDPQGHMDIIENIAVDFHDKNHGIYRFIPSKYKGHPEKIHIVSISSPSGAASQYTTSYTNNNLVIKIGDPTKQNVTGPQAYLIKYSVENIITYYPNHDELYWDINGDQWGQPIERVNARFHVPENLALSLQDKTACYTGSYGSKSTDCVSTISSENSGKLVSFSASNLSPYETLSVVMAFNTGTFAPYTWRDTAAEHLGDIIIAGLAISATFLVFRRWWRWGKDPKGSGIIVPQYGPPKGINIVDAGVLQDYRFDNKDVTAVIIDLAIRGYLTITETDNKKFFKTTTTTTLTLNMIDPKLSDYETSLLQALFDKDLEPGSVVTLGKYISGMQGAIASIGKQSQKKLEAAGFFDKSPERPGSALLILALLLCLSLIVIGLWSKNYLGAITSIAALILIIVFIALMPRRTRMGVMYNEELAGLKVYLQTAEADRIKMLQSPNAKYAANAKAPKRTVQLFEKLLPYAIIFGVEKDWAKQFDNIYKSPPDWYQGNWTTFNAYMLASHINSATSSFNSSFSPPSSSSGSGFSGGGAGGGGGGGGGGGW